MDDSAPTPQRDHLRNALQVGGYVLAGYCAIIFIGGLLTWVGGELVGVGGGDLLAALAVNWLALRVFTELQLPAIGLWWNRASADNLVFGICGGIGAACLVLAPPLLFGAAHIAGTPADRPSIDTVVFVTIALAAGSAGEEIFFRGYAFQLLLKNYGALATVIPVGIVFAALHMLNPNATVVGLVNTAGFGILFGYAWLRSRELWLPIGLHFGWNFTLPLFGANVSGLRIKETGYDMVWSAGRLWSGGEYGPEASILTTAVLAVLFVYLWKAPIRRQVSPMVDSSPEPVVCEPSPPFSS
ncbi:MAG TPA: type II CAAX endopeptidase family protein [Candidatus Limnocylindrales bacterium]|nr:type II CAAX endopeptidase family protein [Candidatus Limnocylindrales bacterium]